MANLINGNGNKAIWAQQDADLIAALVGNVTGIAKVGNEFAATQEDANTIGLSDGVILTKEGRRIQLDTGSVDLFDIPTGTAGVTSYYIIGYKLIQYADASQTCETFVQKMNSSSETITEDTFKSGAIEVYVSCYRVTQVGLNISSIDALLPSLSAISQKIGTESGTVGIYSTQTVEKISYDDTNQQLILKVNGADTPVPFSSGSEVTLIDSGTAQTWYMQTGSTPTSKTIDIKNFRDDWAELVNSDFIVSESGNFVNTGPYASGVSYAGCGIARYSQNISYNATTGILTFTRPYYRCWAYNSQTGLNYVANNYAWTAYNLYCIK